MRHSIPSPLLTNVDLGHGLHRAADHQRGAAERAHREAFHGAGRALLLRSGAR